MSIEGKTAPHFSEIGRESSVRWGKNKELYCCSVATWPDYWYDFLEVSRVLPINKEIVEVLWHSCARRRGWFGRTWQSRGAYWMKAGVQNK